MKPLTICQGCVNRPYTPMLKPSRPEKCDVCGTVSNNVTYTYDLADVINTVQAHAMDCGCTERIVKDLLTCGLAERRITGRRVYRPLRGVVKLRI